MHAAAVVEAAVRASEEAASHGVSHWWFGIGAFAILGGLLVITMMLKVEPKPEKAKSR